MQLHKTEQLKCQSAPPPAGSPAHLGHQGELLSSEPHWKCSGSGTEQAEPFLMSSGRLHALPRGTGRGSVQGPDSPSSCREQTLRKSDWEGEADRLIWKCVVEMLKKNLRNQHQRHPLPSLRMTLQPSRPRLPLTVPGRGSSRLVTSPRLTGRGTFVSMCHISHA